MEKYIEIGGRLHSTATGNVTTGANEILDDELNKKQSQINSETLQHVESIDAALQELSPDQTQALALATDVNTLKAKSVRGDETQSLTDVEKEQAISNIGVTGVYDISGEHPVSGHPKKYSTLAAALADVPVGRRKSGMSVKALMQLTQEMYHVEVTEGVTDLPTGYNEYELSEASPMTTGDYTYSELDTENFGTIPSTVGASVLYYIYDSQSSSYTTWLLTKSSDSTYAYKQYLYMQEYANTTAGNTAFLTASNWQGVDDKPTAGSDNLVKSGGVVKELALGAVYDVSAKNPTAGPNNDGKFESLSALLSDANLNALIPTAVRRGGMSIKFIQSSDNKYVQYRCIADSFTTDESQWVISEEGIYIDSPEFLWARTDKDGRIFVAIKTDGSVYFGKGCPQQVVDYVTQHIDVILSSLSEKVDKVSGKSLIQTDVAENMEFKDYPYFIGATTDANGRILEDINIKGEKEINIPIETHSLGIRTIESTEWSQVILNNTGKVLAGRDKNGKAKEFVGLEATKIVADLLTANSTNARYINVKDELVLSKEATKKLKDALSLDQDLPDYYFDNDYIVNKARVINELWLNTGANADIFAFFTDAHYVNNAMITALLMKYLLCNSSISKVIYGGDTATNQSEDTIADVVAETQTAKAIIPYAKYFPVKGNHDYYDDNVTLPRSAVINNILNSCNVDGIVLNENDIAPYYYYDEKFSKTRYIVIDEYYDHAVLQVKSAQFSFLASALNGTPSGYSITIIAHTSIVNGTIHSTVEYDRAENLRNFINAFQNKTTVTIDGNTYDFTGATSKIVLFIAGHGHADMQNYLNDILYVSVPCSAMWGDIRYSPMYTYHEYPNRTKDTINEDCFDVVVLDKNNNVVNSIRIGDGFNRRFNLSPIEISVGNSETLVASISNIAQWLIHDSTGATYDSSKSYGTERWTFTNNVATITSEGIVTALSAGECYAIAIADNGDKEFFYIKVQ